MKPFPWRSGMVAIDAYQDEWTLVSHEQWGVAAILTTSPDRFGCWTKNAVHHWDDVPKPAHPKETDPGTLGHLLASAQEAWAPVGVVAIQPPIAASLGEPWSATVTNYTGDRIATFKGESQFGVIEAVWEAAPQEEEA